MLVRKLLLLQPFRPAVLTVPDRIITEWSVNVSTSPTPNDLSSIFLSTAILPKSILPSWEKRTGTTSTMFVARNEKAQPSPPISPVSTIQLKLTTGPDNMAHSSISDKDGEPSSPIVSGQVKWTVVCQAFVMFIVSIDSTILTTTLPVSRSRIRQNLLMLMTTQTVASALGANSNESFWIAASYLLASASCQPVMATMADLCGRMAVSSAAVLLFTIGSVICSVASTVSQMLIGRTIQGIGGGGMTSLNLIILADLIPLRERSRYLGFIQLIFGLGTCLAPILGALLAERDWRW
jgi:hypothetical protein